MSSSFRRAAPRSGESLASLRGTKAWTGGITLTSVGLRDLDAVLGGGQPLGTCILLEEDRWTRDLALCLIKYWCAEALCSGQTLVIPTSRPNTEDTSTKNTPSLTEESLEGAIGSEPVPFAIGCSPAEAHCLIESLPRNLHWDKASDRTSEETAPLRPLEILEEEEGGDAEEGLQIAWQYRKSIQEDRSGRKRVVSRAANSESISGPSDGIYCHSYNLSGRLQDQRCLDEYVHIVDARCRCSSNTDDGACLQSRSCGFRLYQNCLRHIKQKLTKSSQVVRLMLYHVSVETCSIALPLLLSHIRTHQLPVVLLVVAQSWTCPNKAALTSLRRTSDVILQTEGFAARVHYPPPPEFRHLHGLMLLPKVSTVTATTANGGGGHFCDMTVSKRTQAHVYGLKRDRRKLHVSLLHIPPEDYAGGGSVSGGAVRSGAGKPKAPKEVKPTNVAGGCGSGGGSSLLDF